MTTSALNSRSTLRHYHFHYCFKFNNISLSHTMNDCNLQQQKRLFEEQFQKHLSQQKKFSYLIEKGTYLAFYSDTFCITVDTVSNERASAATALRYFQCLNVNLDEVLPVEQLSVVDKYVKENDILEIFYPRVISAIKMNCEFTLLKEHLDTILCNSLDRALDHTKQPGHIVKEIGQQLREFQSKLSERQNHLASSSRAVKYEKPYTNWLREYLQCVLAPHEFTVDADGVNIKPIAPVNEYVTSQPDLLLFHNKYTDALNGLYIQASDHETVALDDMKVTGFAGEFKVDEAKGSAENECFFNMVGQGVNLAMMTIEKGQIISCISIYGIVVATKKPEEATLLQVIMNLNKSKCIFRRVYRPYKFSVLLNMIIEHLHR